MFCMFLPFQSHQILYPGIYSWDKTKATAGTSEKMSIQIFCDQSSGRKCVQVEDKSQITIS